MSFADHNNLVAAVASDRPISQKYPERSESAAV
jgi:hypothetical protein